MRDYLWIGLGGFLGAVLRVGIGRGIERWSPARLPLGTLVVNVLGCAALGALMAWFEARETPSIPMRLFLSAGLLGGLTTFSTFSFETVRLSRDSGFGLALSHVALQLALGIGAAALAYAQTRARLS